MARTCSRCGTVAGGHDGAAAVGWSFETTPRGTTWTCPACTREHVRAIEAKLPEEWW